jgi:hypothetical protein
MDSHRNIPPPDRAVRPSVHPVIRSACALLSLCAVGSAVAVIAFAPTGGASTSSPSDPTARIEASVIDPSTGFLDAESQLARGEPLPLETVTLLDLELIPGVSFTLATKILAAKGEIQTRAQLVAPPHRFRALEAVHGIGPKTALRLSRYLRVAKPFLP